MENSQQLTDIVLPRELASGALTLEEIGTIFVLMCIMQQYSDFWNSNDEFVENVVKLIDEGIVVLTDDDKVEIDLTWI